MAVRRSKTSSTASQKLKKPSGRSGSAGGSSRHASLKKRAVQFDLSGQIQKHWHRDGPFKTHFLNSLTLIFPDGEKYFIRSINPFLKKFKDPKLRKEAELFITQEAQHNIQHRKFFQNLKNHGYNIDILLFVINLIAYRILEPALGKKLNLAVTAGLEHYTALLAEIGLESGFLDGAHPELKALFSWHAAEEIEHKSVAFDALKSVDDSYLLRVGGLMIATSLLVSFSTLCTLSLLTSDGLIAKPKVIKDMLDLLLLREKLFPKSVMVVLRYLARDFHPDKIDNLALAQSVFRQLKKDGHVRKEL